MGLLPWCSAADGIAEAYDRYLFHGATLQALPDPTPDGRIIIGTVLAANKKYEDAAANHPLARGEECILSKVFRLTSRDHHNTILERG